MANNTILTPGGDYQEDIQESVKQQYLEINKFLSEYETENEKSVVRENLNVPSKDNVYTKQDTDIVISENIRNAIQEYLNMEDPHGILPTVEQMIKGMLKSDGSTPFTVPQSGVDPISDNHLTTKKFVQRLLKEHLNSEDPHNILPEVQDLLEKYVKITDIYSKKQLYTRDEITKLFKDYLKKDGSTPFTKAQVGVDPTIDGHLTTKRYVDSSLYKHLVDVDPHGFITILNQRLSSYIKKKDVFDKTQTYSRTQIDNIISKIVESTVEASIQEYVDSINDKFENIRKQKYIKQDGSIPFRNPQSGVDAVEESELVTLRQLLKSVENIQTEFNEKLDNKECTWITSGPVQTTVGFVEDETELAKEVSLQEIMDAIFYGKGISINVPEIGRLGQSVDVTVCLQGTLINTDYAELYQDGKIIGIFTKSEFEESGCITVKSEVINGDSEFTFKVYYLNGSSHEISKTVKVALPVFAGILPKWKFGNVVTYEYLLDLYNEDKKNNKFYDYSKNIKELTHKYNFEDSKLQHLFLAIPANYPDLYQMCTPSQQFGTDAFDIIDMIPFQVPGASSDIIYKIYIYKQALASLNIPVTFKFETE